MLRVDSLSNVNKVLVRHSDWGEADMQALSLGPSHSSRKVPSLLVFVHSDSTTAVPDHGSHNKLLLHTAVKRDLPE